MIGLEAQFWVFLRGAVLHRFDCISFKNVVDSLSDSRSRGPEFDSRPVSYFFMEIDHEIISMVVVSYK